MTFRYFILFGIGPVKSLILGMIVSELALFILLIALSVLVACAIGAYESTNGIVHLLYTQTKIILKKK